MLTNAMIYVDIIHARPILKINYDKKTISGPMRDRKIYIIYIDIF